MLPSQQLTVPDNFSREMLVGKRLVHIRWTDVARFIQLLETQSTGCMHWGGYVNEKTGYGYYGLAAQVTVLAHRFAFTIWRRPIAPGLEIDHECHNRDLNCLLVADCPHRRCENPWHLEATTRSLNLSNAGMTRPKETHRNGRKTHCDEGHEFTDANTYMWKDERHCRICRAAAAREFRRRKRERSQ